MGREEFLEKARAGVKEAYLERDRPLMQCVNAIDEIDKASNLLFERVQEWYGIYFPELRVREPDKYCELVMKIDRRNINAEEISLIVGGDKAREIQEKARRSMGVDLSGKDLNEVRELAREVLNLRMLSNSIEKYETELAKELCPNLTYLIDAPLAAKLIAHAGGLKRLATMPASTSPPDAPTISPAARAAGITGAPGCSEPAACVSSKSSECASAPFSNAAPAGV